MSDTAEFYKTFWSKTRHRYSVAWQLRKSVVLRVLRTLPGHSLMDLGCGSGELLSELSQRAEFGGWHICGADIAVDAARRNCSHIEFFEVDLNAGQLPDGCWDVVLCLEVFEHLDRSVQDMFFGTVRRLLKPGGYLIMSTPFVEGIRAMRRANESEQDFFKRFEGQPVANIWTLSSLEEGIAKGPFKLVDRHFVGPNLGGRWLNAGAGALSLWAGVGGATRNQGRAHRFKHVVFVLEAGRGTRVSA
jgi:cyclopropane fatty-acyl-phospholipid synthase-like methyltransferase